MANYDELLAIAPSTGGTLLGRIRVAAQVAAGNIIGENPATANHAARLAWARATFADPDTAARELIWPVLVINKAAAASAITGAADSLVQTAVDTAVTALAV